MDFATGEASIAKQNKILRQNAGNSPNSIVVMSNADYLVVLGVGKIP